MRLRIVTCSCPGHPGSVSMQKMHSAFPMWNMYFMRSAQSTAVKNHTCCWHMCKHTHVTLFLCLLLHQRLLDTLWFLPSLFWKKTPGSWQLTWPQYICFNAGKRCGRCVLRGPSLAVGDPGPVHHVATEQLRRISILRSTEWGRVFSGMFFSSRSDSQALSLEHPQERSFFFPVYLPVSLSCQLFKRPRASFCSTAQSHSCKLSSSLSHTSQPPYI